jgi:hypothetical protein
VTEKQSLGLYMGYKVIRQKTDPPCWRSECMRYTQTELYFITMSFVTWVTVAKSSAFTRKINMTLKMKLMLASDTMCCTLILWCYSSEIRLSTVFFYRKIYSVNERLCLFVSAYNLASRYVDNGDTELCVTCGPSFAPPDRPLILVDSNTVGWMTRYEIKRLVCVSSTSHFLWMRKYMCTREFMTSAALHLQHSNVASRTSSFFCILIVIWS